LKCFLNVKLHYLSDNSGDNLLFLLKQFIDRHPTIENVFLYKKMKSVNSAVSRALSSLYESFEININFPDQLLGKNNNEKLKVKRALDQRNNNTSGQYMIAKGYGLNIIQLVSEYLITTDLKDIHTINLVTNYGFNQTFNKEKIYFELSNHLKFIKRITMDYETVP